MNNINSSKINDLAVDTNTSDQQDSEPVRRSRRTTTYQPDSYWSNVKYGIGMLAFILIPVVTGMSVKVTVIGLYALIIGFCIMLAVFYFLRSRKSTSHRRRGRD